MGQVLSYVSYFFSWGAPADSYSTDPDPDTGLSEYDRQLISMTWALAADKKVRKKNGVEFFMQLFKAYPYMLDYFPSFKGRELDDLRNDPKLKAHALSVMFAIGSFVDSMDDPEALVGLVQKLAVSHVQRDIKAGQFEDLAKMFIPFLDSLLGDSNTPDIRAAWTKLLGAQSAIVKQTETEMSNENTG